MQFGSRASFVVGQQRRGRENVRASKFVSTSAPFMMPLLTWTTYPPPIDSIHLSTSCSHTMRAHVIHFRFMSRSEQYAHTLCTGLNNMLRSSQALQLPRCKTSRRLAFLYTLGATLSLQIMPMKSDGPQGSANLIPDWTGTRLDERHGNVVSNITSSPTLWPARLICFVTRRSLSARSSFHKTVCVVTF